MNAAYKQGLQHLAGWINTTTLHHNDIEKCVDLFSKLIKAGERVVLTDEIGQYLQGEGVPKPMAADIQTIYEVLITADKPLNWYSEQLINEYINSNM